MVYVVIQALNPAIDQVYLPDGRYVVRLREAGNFISWLPTGVNANYEIMNTWRQVVFWSGAWLFVCALWVSLQSRRAWLALAWMALITAAILSVTSIAHHLSNDQHLFWMPQYARNGGAFGPFVYRNQSAAYLYLSMALGLMLFLYLMRRGHMRSGLPWMAFLLAAICAAGIVINPSRGGWIGGAAVIALFLAVLPMAIDWSGGISKPVMISSLMVLLLFIGAGAWLFRDIDLKFINTKWERLYKGTDTSAYSRVKLTEMTWEMFTDKPWTGWGGGSFPYNYFVYALDYPELYFGNYNVKGAKQFYSQYYKQSHNDHFQFLSEYGVIGAGMMLMCFLYWVVCSMRLLPVVDAVFGLGVNAIFIAHNFADFFFQNSAILISWMLLLAMPACLLNKRVCRN